MGVRRYLCKACGHSFRSARKPSRLRSALWKTFLWNRATVFQLAKRHTRSVNWIRKELRAYKLPDLIPPPCKMVAVMDCVFFGRTSGYLVVRDPHRRANVYWSEVGNETLAEYQCARDTLEGLGFVIQAVVADGKPGLKRLFADLPVQMCHFHMKAIITHHLTRRPKLAAGRELKEMVRPLCDTDEESFATALSSWHVKWGGFLKERTTDPTTGRWRYTHRRLRAAYRSLASHLPYLFTYLRYPGLDIPNTTNALDGSFTHLKELLQIHRGLKADLKRKATLAILQNRPQKK